MLDDSIRGIFIEAQGPLLFPSFGYLDLVKVLLDSSELRKNGMTFGINSIEP